MRLYATEHLSELIAGIEGDGRVVAERVNAAAREFVDATLQRAEIEQRLFAVLSLTRVTRPGDVNRARSDQAVAAVTTLLREGGEVGPELRVELPTGAAA